MQDNSVAAAAGADAGGGSSSMMMLPPQFIQNPVGYLSEVASMRPSSNGLSALAGPVSQWFSNPPSDVSSDQLGQIASVYLQAASGQLKDVDVKVGDVEQEMTRTKQKYQIMDVSFYGREKHEKNATDGEDRINDSFFFLSPLFPPPIVVSVSFDLTRVCNSSLQE